MARISLQDDTNFDYVEIDCRDTECARRTAKTILENSDRYDSALIYDENDRYVEKLERDKLCTKMIF